MVFFFKRTFAAVSLFHVSLFPLLSSSLSPPPVCLFLSSVVSVHHCENHHRTLMDFLVVQHTHTHTHVVVMLLHTHSLLVRVCCSSALSFSNWLRRCLSLATASFSPSAVAPTETSASVAMVKPGQSVGVAWTPTSNWLGLLSDWACLLLPPRL